MDESAKSDQLTLSLESPSVKIPLKNRDSLDSSQILRNLSISVEQRLEEHQQSLNLCIELMNAGKKLVE
jgi:hypothetical protein